MVFLRRKKRLWWLLAVLFMGLGMRAYGQEYSFETVVYGNIAEAIEVTRWPDLEWAIGSDLNPGEEIISPVQTFSVRSNANWYIDIASDSPTGQLREYHVESGQYIASGLRTANPLRWTLIGSGTTIPVTDEATPMVRNMSPTGETPVDVSFRLRFLPSFDDVRLTDRVYRIRLFYTVGIGY